MSELSSSSSSSFHGFFKNVHTSSVSQDYKYTPSPTSILDAKSSPESTFANPFERDLTAAGRRSPASKQAEAIGLALIDSFADGHEMTTATATQSFSSPSKAVIERMALLGSKLKVQIPTTNPQSPPPAAESPRSPADFGIKTRNNVAIPHQLASMSSPSKEGFRRQLSLKEMELSEDYTCVIIHGPNPKTTHIFDDCVVDGDLTEVSSEITRFSSVSFCHTCKKVLGKEKEMYVYRGVETDFCSQECFYQAKINE